MNRYKAKTPGRPPKTTCRALIPLDTKKIRAEYLKAYKRRKKALEKIEAELQQFDENDEPEFQQFLARTFGAEQTRERELAERIRLCIMRYEKIRFLAGENRMSKERYCHTLSEKVTAELDFWAVLEAELLAFQEAGRKTREEEFGESEDSAHDSGWDEDGEDEADDDFDSECDEAFKQFLGEDGNTPGSESDQRDLKKLYRELCLRYHPDRAGAHDAKTKCLWIEIQEAYQDGNLVRLRSIHAGIDLETGKTELGCAEIDSMILDLGGRIREIRSELRARKQAPYWGFSSWTEKKRKQAARELKFEFDREFQIGGRKLRQLEAELEQLLHAWKPKSQSAQKPGRKTKAELRMEIEAEIADLFDLDF